ncbi:tetratricopeptide repeat protein [Aurantivibrio infirmus]
MLRRHSEYPLSLSLALLKRLFSAALVVVIILLSACATTKPPIDPADSKLVKILLSQTSSYTSEIYPKRTSEMLAVNDEMRSFLKNSVNDLGSKRDKVENLFFAITDNPGLNIQYENTATLTAEQVFAERRANCVGFSSLFIAMARELGIDVYFQEVELPPEWASIDTDTLVQYRHVNVLVPMRGKQDAVVDFRYDRFSDTYPRRRISDTEALGHFLSNFGMEALVAGELEKAKAYMLQALKVAPKKSFVWNNMGIIQRRLGNLDLAEASYRQAIALDPQQVSAVTNLSIIYEQREDFELARRLREYGDQVKLRNPYYRYALAQNAYQNGEYDDALALMDRAVRVYREEHRFYYLRGLSLWRLGNTKKAVINMRRAMRVTSDEELISQYQDLIAEWQGSNS